MAKKFPEDKDLQAILAETEAKVKKAAEGAEFDPERYFYAQAYLDYFQNKHFARAVDDLEQVMVFRLRPRSGIVGCKKEEIAHFMEEAQVNVDEESRRTRQEIASLLDRIQADFQQKHLDQAFHAAQRVLVLDPENEDAQGWARKIERDMALEAAKTSRAMLARGRGEAPSQAEQRHRPMPDPEWLESRYREALKNYVSGNVAKAIEQIQQLLTYDPTNDRWLKTLYRMQQEAVPKPAAHP